MRRFIITATILTTLFVGALLFVNPVQADEKLTPDQLTKIKSNCTTIKTSVSQLHSSDALLRVNRGQLYVSMANNLMDNFNSRLASNGLDNKAMTTVTASYRTAFDKFFNDYIAYEQKLSDALRIDCQSNPQEFHDALLAARELRFTVHDDVQKLHRSIDDYRTSLGDFLLAFERISR